MTYVAVSSVEACNWPIYARSGIQATMMIVRDSPDFLSVGVVEDMHAGVMTDLADIRIVGGVPDLAQIIAPPLHPVCHAASFMFHPVCRTRRRFGLCVTG